MNNKESLTKYAQCYEDLREVEKEIVDFSGYLDDDIALELGLSYCIRELVRNTVGHQQTKESFYHKQMQKASNAVDAVLRTGFTEKMKNYLSEQAFFQKEMSEMTGDKDFQNLSTCTMEVVSHIPNFVDRKIATEIVMSEMGI